MSTGVIPANQSIQALPSQQVKVPGIRATKIFDKIVTLDHKTATDYLATTRDGGGIKGLGLKIDELSWVRKFYQGTADKYARDMNRGKFNWDQVTIVQCEVGRGKNKTLAGQSGQHTCAAVLQLPEGPYRVRWTIYRAKNWDEVRGLYKSVDCGKPHTRQESISASLLGTPEFPDAPKAVLTCLSGGVAHWYFEDDPAQRPDYDLHAEMLKTTEHKRATAIVDLFNQYTKQERSHVQRTPVMAAMLGTWSKAPGHARKFWQGVIDGVMLERTDPGLKLRNFLMTTAQKRAPGGGKSRKKVVHAREIVVACLQAWNAFREGREFAKFALSDTTRPKIV